MCFRTLYNDTCWRPYHVECTGSLLTSEVKRHRARLVLGWGTAWEDLRVLPAQSDPRGQDQEKKGQGGGEGGRGRGNGKGKGKRQRQRQRPAGPCLCLCLFLLISKSRDFLHLHVKAGPSKYLWVAMSGKATSCTDMSMMKISTVLWVNFNL